MEFFLQFFDGVGQLGIVSEPVSGLVLLSQHPDLGRVNVVRIRKIDLQQFSHIFILFKVILESL